MNENIGKSVKNYLMIMISIIICIVMVFFSVRIFLSTRSNDTEESTVDMSSEVSSICELATVRAYYHNVADLGKQPDGLFKYGLFKYGYKKIWMEYSGIVEVGIDVNEVKVSEPDDRGIVEVYVPDARVINVDADPDTLTAPLVDTGAFTEISVEDKAQAFSAAQTTMDEKARADKNLLSQAKSRAKELLKEYIVNTGKQMGVKYKVKWIDN